MSSTNKTTHLKLNSWIGSDKPKRVDFNYDNEVIDKTIHDHITDTVVHINDSERDKWNNYMYVGMYFGTGDSSRVIKTDCPFDVNMGIVFAVNKHISVMDFSENHKTNYCAFLGTYGESSGVKLLDDLRSFRVNQNYAILGREYINLNEIGVSYIYMMFR